MLDHDQKKDFDALLPGQSTEAGATRRTALKTALGVGYAATAMPIMAQTAIKTSSEGLKTGETTYEVNGQVKQNATLNHMIWSVAEQISKLSEAFELFPGDIIYSGTPENVGPVVKGDVIECHIDGLPELSVKIV